MTNPYDPPQSDLRTSKPRVVYVNKFNGKLAFWSGLAIALVLLVLFIPAIETDRTQPRTLVGDISRYIIIAMISIGLGLFLGSISGTPVPQAMSDSDAEEPPPHEPTR